MNDARTVVLKGDQREQGVRIHVLGEKFHERTPAVARTRKRRVYLIERDDLKQLRLQLMTKLKQQEQSQPVHVAPVLGGAVNSTDAKQ